MVLRRDRADVDPAGVVRVRGERTCCGGDLRSDLDAGVDPPAPGGCEVEKGQTEIRLAVLARPSRGGDDGSEVGLLAGRSRAAERERHDPRLAAVLERPHVDRLGLGERLSDHVRAAELVRDARGAQEARATPAAVRAERSRPLECRNRDRECAAPDRTFGRVVEERGGRLVGRVGRGRAMPGRPIDVADDFRQCAVRSMPVPPRSPAAGSPTG